MRKSDYIPRVNSEGRKGHPLCLYGSNMKGYRTLRANVQGTFWKEGLGGGIVVQGAQPHATPGSIPTHRLDFSHGNLGFRATVRQKSLVSWWRRARIRGVNRPNPTQGIAMKTSRLDSYQPRHPGVILSCVPHEGFTWLVRAR
jgi:hypothetical protein